MSAAPCDVCGKPHVPGKGGAAKGMCARCYKREQRHLPPDPNPPPKPMGKTRSLHFFAPVKLADAIEAAAGENLSAWLREAAEAKLTNGGTNGNG